MLDPKHNHHHEPKTPLWWASLFITLFSATVLGFISFGAFLLLFPGAPIALAFVAFVAAGLIESTVFFKQIHLSLKQLQRWLSTTAAPASNDAEAEARKRFLKYCRWIAIAFFSAGFATWYAFNGYQEIQCALAGLSHWTGVSIGVASQAWLYPLIIFSLVVMGVGYLLWMHTNLRRIFRGKTWALAKTKIAEIWSPTAESPKNIYDYVKAFSRFLLALGMTVITVLATIALTGLNSHNQLIQIFAFAAFLVPALLSSIYLTLKSYDKIVTFLDKQSIKSISAGIKNIQWRYWLNPFFLLYRLIKALVFIAHCAAIGLLSAAGAAEGMLPLNSKVTGAFGTATEAMTDFTFMGEGEEAVSTEKKAQETEWDDDESHEHFDVFAFITVPLAYLAVGIHVLLGCLFSGKIPTKAMFSEQKKVMFPDDHAHAHCRTDKADSKEFAVAPAFSVDAPAVPPAVSPAVPPVVSPAVLPASLCNIL